LTKSPLPIQALVKSGGKYSAEMNVLMLPDSAIETGSNPLSAGRDGSEDFW